MFHGITIALSWKEDLWPPLNNLVEGKYACLMVK